MTNLFEMAGVGAWRFPTFCLLQRVLPIIMAMSLLQTLEANVPSECLEGRLNIWIPAADGQASSNQSSCVLNVNMTTEALQRFGESAPQLIAMLKQSRFQCNITLLKNTALFRFSRTLLPKYQFTKFTIDKLIGLMYTLSNRFITISGPCRLYTGATQNLREYYSLFKVHLRFNCAVKAIKDGVMVTRTNILIDLDTCFYSRSTHRSVCLVNCSLLYMNLKCGFLDAKLIGCADVLLRIACLAQFCIFGKTDRGYFKINASNTELDVVYHYVRSLIAISLLPSHLNESETRPAVDNFTFDNYRWARWIFLASAIFLQFFMPVFHLLTYTGNERLFRILSFYAFLSFFTWLSFYTFCTTLNCYHYGQVMHDLSLFCNIMLPMCYLILISESCISTELLSITNTLENMSIGDYIENLRKALPGRYCNVKCYNYGLFRKKVLCFKESRLFSVEYSVDLSDDPPFVTNGMTRVCLSMDIDFGDEETAQKYREVEIETLHANCHRGSHVYVTHHDFIPGFHDIVCGYSDKGRRPYWMNPSFYVLISIFGLSWPYRLIFWIAVKTRKYTIKKLIFSSYPGTEETVHESSRNTENIQSIARQNKEQDNACDLKSLKNTIQPNGDLKASLGGTVFYIPNKFNAERRAIFIQRI